MTLADWLGALSEHGLARVLTLRPDALAPPQPTSLELLSSRLGSDRSVDRAMAELDVRVLLVTEVLQAFARADSARVDRAAVERLVGADRRGVLDFALGVLHERALVWSDETTLYLPERLADFWDAPLSLGAPVSELVNLIAPPHLHNIVKAVGAPQQRTQARAAEVVAAALSDPDQVRRLAGGVSSAARALLDALAWEEPRTALPFTVYSGLHKSEPTDELLASGLVLPIAYSHGEMPREVGLALRGEDYHPDIPASLPRAATHAADPGHVRRQMLHAVPDAVQAVSDLAELCGHAPLAVLKNGGVGVRELRRAAKESGRSEDEVGFWIDLAAATGLIAVGRSGVAPTPEYDAWRRLEPADRWVPIADAWWALPHVPGHRTDDVTGRAPAVLATQSCSPGVVRLRQDMLRALGNLPEGAAVTGPDTLFEELGARRPMMLPFGDRSLRYVHATWHETERLGLTADGALTPIGYAYLRARPPAGAADAADRRALSDQLRSVVPDTETVATFQADLTAVVAGPPSGQLADLLSSAADLESRGAATSWRFSAGSVRRALDAGRTAEALLADLEAVAAHPLPQPLAYLIRDVGRTHGVVRATTVGCCLISDDAGVLAEILATAGHGPLRALELRRLAPTVLASAQPVDVTLARLRDAGYAPVEQAADGSTVVEFRPAARTAPRAAGDARPVAPSQRAGAAPRMAPVEKLDAVMLAKRLRAAPRRAARQIPSPAPVGARPEQPGATEWESEAVLRRAAPHLNDAEIRLLAFALDTGAAVHIDYVDTRGSRTSRVVERLLLLGDALVGWCRLRSDERIFLVKSVQAVAPA